MREHTRAQVHAQIRKDDKDQRKRDKLEPRTAKNRLVIPEEDLPPIISFTDNHFELPCLGCVRSCLAGKGELEHCKADPTRRAARCALYESSSHKCEPIYVLKKALLNDDENMISNARVAIRLQLDSLYDPKTTGFYSARDKATKPLIIIGKAQEKALEEGLEEDDAEEGGSSSAEQKKAARKLIKTLSALL
ncbi:hypothetical protein Forpe1208_v009620 [Fusarium oxysporum f. sp. rapae]|uniref:Uncharacterized protein n=1 Tax=Fusarium oxysporum f. sp. rapae TaxID=485398 RepID=A0A8J5NVY3_FUSOX|nr:hypothetical protein Forpe1208_v009620 [Fusarium oxysporum f. sp. rapae]